MSYTQYVIMLNNCNYINPEKQNAYQVLNSCINNINYDENNKYVNNINLYRNCFSNLQKINESNTLKNDNNDDIFDYYN